MAERRMFAKTIIDSDAFIDMPVTARLLYYDLAMRADDDGFVNSPKKIMRMIGASQDDVNILIMRKFILPFDNGIVVIKHWRIHNYIRKDTYKATTYIEQKAMLDTDENNAYTFKKQEELYLDDEPWTSRGRAVDEPSTQVRVGKDRVGQDSLVECSVVDGDTATTTEDDELRQLNGPLGQGVVWLTENQISSLLDRMNIEAFDRYVKRLADFIIDKKAHVKNHYETILKWYKEDSGIANK